MTPARTNLKTCPHCLSHDADSHPPPDTFLDGYITIGKPGVNSLDKTSRLGDTQEGCHWIMHGAMLR